jgi:hypothetical protein
MLQKYLESSEMWYCKRTENINWTHCVRNEKVLHTGEVYPTHHKNKANWIGHILCRNLKCLIERMIQVPGRHRTKCKQLLDDLKEIKGYWKLKKEAIDHTL